jgi:hypothetical protein
MNGDGFHVRGFGDISGGRGGIAWKLPAGGGGVQLADGRAAPVEADAIGSDSDERWSFYFPVEDEPLTGSAIFRHIVVEMPEGVIVCTAEGAEGIPGHGEERANGILHSGGEEVRFDETLISTQYDGDGRPTRFGLELWPVEADQANRAAATRASGSLLGGAQIGNTWAGLFRCHANGFEGHGSYVLWRA